MFILEDNVVAAEAHDLGRLVWTTLAVLRQATAAGRHGAKQPQHLQGHLAPIDIGTHVIRDGHLGMWTLT